MNLELLEKRRLRLGIEQSEMNEQQIDEKIENTKRK